MAPQRVSPRIQTFFSVNCTGQYPSKANADAPAALVAEGLLAAGTAGGAAGTWATTGRMGEADGGGGVAAGGRGRRHGGRRPRWGGGHGRPTRNLGQRQGSLPYIRRYAVQSPQVGGRIKASGDHVQQFALRRRGDEHRGRQHRHPILLGRLLGIIVVQMHGNVVGLDGPADPRLVEDLVLHGAALAAPRGGKLDQDQAAALAGGPFRGIERNLPMHGLLSQARRGQDENGDRRERHLCILCILRSPMHRETSVTADL